MLDNFDAWMNDPQSLRDEFLRLRGMVEVQQRTLEQYKTYVTDLERRLQKLLPQSEVRSTMRDALQGPTLFDPAGAYGTDSEPDTSEDSTENTGDDTQGPPGPKHPPMNGPKKPQGRRPLPPNLERQDVIHSVNLNELPDYDPNKGHTKLADEISEQLHLIKPELKVLRHRRETILYRTPTGQIKIVTAGAPSKVFDKTIPTPTVLAKIANDKYYLHLPLYRIEAEFGQMGYRLPRSTSSLWLGRMAELLAPIPQAMAAAIRQSFKIHLDDTTVSVLAPGTKSSDDFRVWALIGGCERHKQVVFLPTPQRTHDAVRKILDGFKGYLQVDACSVYDGLFRTGQVYEVGCWSHAFRQFDDLKNIDRRVQPMRIMIRKLYDLEQLARDRQLDSLARCALRLEQSQPILERIRKWVDEQRALELIHSGFKKALNYVNNQWAALNRFLEDGRLDIDNNAVEAEFHVLGVGRRNWLFFASELGLQHGLVLFTLVRSCVANGIDPFIYFEDVLQRISTHPASRVLELAPAHWKDLVEPEKYRSSIARPPQTANAM